jgi:hypothetical protein
MNGDFQIHTDDFGDVDSTPLADAIQTLVKFEQQRIDRAIRGAIRAGYDGVDINRRTEDLYEVGASEPVDTISGDIASIEPWHRPAPDGANGHQTERYTWDWFTDETLTDILTDDEFVATLLEESDE